MTWLVWWGEIRIAKNFGMGLYILTQAIRLERNKWIFDDGEDREHEKNWERERINFWSALTVESSRGFLFWFITRLEFLFERSGLVWHLYSFGLVLVITNSFIFFICQWIVVSYQKKKEKGKEMTHHEADNRIEISPLQHIKSISLWKKGVSVKCVVNQRTELWFKLEERKKITEKSNPTEAVSLNRFLVIRWESKKPSPFNRNPILKPCLLPFRSWKTRTFWKIENRGLESFSPYSQ